MEAPTSFGAWLRQRRCVLDLTRAVLAGCASCSVSILQKFEIGERRPTKQRAGMRVVSLEISPDELEWVNV